MWWARPRQTGSQATPKKPWSNSRAAPHPFRPFVVSPFPRQPKLHGQGRSRSTGSRRWILPCFQMRTNNKLPLVLVHSKMTLCSDSNGRQRWDIELLEFRLRRQERGGIIAKCGVHLYEVEDTTVRWQKGMFVLMEQFCGIIEIFLYSVQRPVTSMSMWFGTLRYRCVSFLKSVGYDNSHFFLCLILFPFLLDLQRNFNELWVTTSFDEAEYICVVYKEN